MRPLSRRCFLQIWGGTSASLLLAACAPSPPPSVAPPTARATSEAPSATSTRPATTAPTAITAPPVAEQAPTAPGRGASLAARAPRGTGRTLRLLSWQAPATLNPYFARGQVDAVAARCCLEPLLTVDNEGRLAPILAAAVPSRENGGLPDASTVVYRLREGVTWADGRPFTADDVVFTYQFVADPKTASATTAPYLALQAVEALDPLTVRLTFKEPTGGWYVPFVGATGMILPRHAFEGYTGEAARAAPFNSKAFGTGPYVVDDFAPGDRVGYAVNPNYREADTPSIGRIELKGGGDAATAARAVLQSGEYDYTWNLQVEAQVLREIAASGRGDLVTAPGAGVELLLLNQADPSTEVDGERSHPSTRHPLLGDPAVRRALTLAIDRPTMAAQLYGGGLTGTATANVLTMPTGLASPSPVPSADLDGAGRLLDEAGYRRGADGIRVTPAGSRMQLVLATTANSLRQKEQALIKDGWQKLGIDTELKAIDSSAYFSSSPDNPDALARFTVDVHMFTVPFTSPFPAALMKRFYAKERSRDWAQRSNAWAPANIVKWGDDEYDRLYDQVLTETDAARSRELWSRLNELVIASNIAIPLIDRTFVAAKAPALRGPAPRAFDLETWNVAEWTTD